MEEMAEPTLGGRLHGVCKRLARIRRDWHHRASLDLSRRFGTVVIEHLNTRNMTGSARGTMEEPGRSVRQKAGLNRSILNQGWHLLENLLDCKLEERGGTIVKVPAHTTSRTCVAMDSRSRKNQVSFVCTTCGHRDHADINAAQVILRRNTALMLVEERHWPSGEARTIGGATSPAGNPRPAGRGRC